MGVSVIFGKLDFLMKCQTMGSNAHFAPFLKVIILLVSEILRKKKKIGLKRALNSRHQGCYFYSAELASFKYHNF